MSASICNSLTAKGFTTLAVSIPPNEGKDKLLAKMKDTKAERLLILALYEWQSDTYINTGLFYNVLLEIFDVKGQKLVEKSLKGEDNLARPDSMWSGIEGMKTTVPRAFKNKIEILFNNKDVVESLR